MVGKGRFGVLATSSPDPVLSVVAPLGLAASVGTALVVDLVGGLHLDGGRTLVEIVGDGPSLDELGGGGRRGVGVLAGGPISAEEAVAPIEELASYWQAVVVRVQAGSWPGPTVPVRPLYPGWLRPEGSGPAVWQPVSSGSSPPGPGPVLPKLRPGVANQLLNGRLPWRSRWVSAWRLVWELPWA